MNKGKFKKKKIFLSHSSLDKSFVDRLATDLESLNIGVWYDKWEIKVGDSLIDKITQGIDKNDYLAVILSENSINSKWVKREINAAFMKEMDTKKIVILPVLLRNCKIPILLSDKKYANFTKEYEVGFGELLDTIDPHNPNNQNNKEYREIKKLLSGLATSDKNGANLLNIYQMLDIYHFKDSLIKSKYMSYEELRLLFLSKIAFTYKNLSISRLIDSHIPVWEFFQDLEDEVFASFIVEKLDGPLFKYLIKYYEWACNILKMNMNRDLIIKASIKAAEITTEDPQSHSKDKDFLQALFETLAKINDEMFNNMNFNDVKNLSKREETLCAIIEASALLENKPSDVFYFSALDSNEETAKSAFKALYKINQIKAIEFLIHTKKLKHIDEPFNLISNKNCIPTLLEWYNKEQSIEIKAKILTVLVNLGHIDDNEIYNFYIGNIDSDNYFIKPTLIRLMGRISNKELFDIKKIIKSRNALEIETGLYSYARLYQNEAINIIKTQLNSDKDSIVAVAIECLSKILKEEALPIINKFSNSPNPIIKTAFYRALYNIGNFNYEEYIDNAFNEKNTEAKIFASKIIIPKMPNNILIKYLNNSKIDIIIKSLIDEYLWGKSPFIQNWDLEINSYNPNLANSKLRIINYDTEKIYLDHHWDRNKTFFNVFNI